ncbi:MAG: 3'-5' exonuclease [Sphingomonadales bacterium]|jgi:DNA polymerase-3 subunit epsilon|nr:3'-5' exonuclease [Sphingomonadales bacterium]MBK9267225.1 3'-5' exonuclease [Sphingomonadales bacterium]
MYLVFDTETTDLPRPNLDLGHPSQPHLLQFAGILFDEHGTELDQLSTLVRPKSGALLSTQAFSAHGITLERAFHLGMESLEVFRWFASAARKARCIIGHNVQFDLQIMAITAAKVGESNWKLASNTYCTMAHAAPLVNLPPTPRMVAAGRYHPKSPTLAECMQHFFGEDLANAHDATADVRACARIFQHMISMEKLV